MTIDEIINLLNVTNSQKLTKVQEMLIRHAWTGKTYTQIAVEINYAENYLRKIAYNIWPLLSNFWGEPITKSNFRQVLEERNLTDHQKLLLQKFNHQEIPQNEPEYPGESLGLNSSFYIDRSPIEEIAYASLRKPGCLIRLKAPPKMGKSSLILRLIDYVTNLGYQTVTINLEQAEIPIFANIDKFLRWFSANICLALNKIPQIDDYWSPDLGSKVSCTQFLEKYILSVANTPLVLIIKQLNIIFEYPSIAGDFLSLLRFWHESGKHSNSWKNLQLLLVQSTTLDPPFEKYQSLFNTGRILQLPYFHIGQLQDLAKRYHLNLSHQQITQLTALVGGHPYLSHKAMYYLWSQETKWDELITKAPTPQGIYHCYLYNLANLIKQDIELLQSFKKVIISSKPIALSSDHAYQLSAVGLINVKGGLGEISCLLYRLYFENEFGLTTI